MKKLLFLSIVVIFGSCQRNGSPATKAEIQGPITLVIHGGAGTIRRENMTPEKEKAYREKLTEALNSGYETLARGGM